MWYVLARRSIRSARNILVAASAYQSNITRAPIKLTSVDLAMFMTTTPLLMGMLSRHYRRDLLGQVRLTTLAWSLAFL